MMQPDNKENFLNQFLDNTGRLTDILHLQDPQNNLPSDVKVEAMIKKMAINTLNKEIQTSYLNGLFFLHLFLNQPIFQTSLQHSITIKNEWQVVLFTKDVAAMIYSICQKLSGSYLINKLNLRLLKCLIEISTNTYKGEKNYEQVMEELKMQKSVLNISDVLDNFMDICNERSLMETIKSDKAKAMNILMEIFANCATQEEQLLLFIQKSPEIINQLVQVDQQNPPSFKLIELMIGFLRTLIFETKFTIQYDAESKDSNVGKIYFDEAIQEDNSVSEPINTEQQPKPYEQAEFSDPKLQEVNRKFLIAMYPLCKKMLNYLFAFLYSNIPNINDEVNNLNNPETLNLYFEKKYEKARFSIFKILQILFEFNQMNMSRQNALQNLEDICQKLSKLLEIYEVGLRIDPEKYTIVLQMLQFLQQISQNEKTKSIYEIIVKSFPLIQDIVSKFTDEDFKNINKLKLEKLNLKTLGQPFLTRFCNFYKGFPLSITIPASKSFSQIIEVWKPKSIIYWAFASKGKDIGFKLIYLGAFDGTNPENLKLPHTVYEKEKIFCQYQPIKGNFLAYLPGLYQIVFDNSYSWFNEKQIRYRIFLLENTSVQPIYLYPLYEIDKIQLELQAKLYGQEIKDSENKEEDNKQNMKNEQQIEQIEEEEEKKCKFILYFQEKILLLIFKFDELSYSEDISINLIQKEIEKKEEEEESGQEQIIAEQQQEASNPLELLIEQIEQKVQEFITLKIANSKRSFCVNIINLPEYIQEQVFEEKLQIILKEPITTVLFHSKLDLFYEHLKQTLSASKLSIIFNKDKNPEYYIFKTKLPMESFLMYNRKCEKLNNNINTNTLALLITNILMNTTNFNNIQEIDIFNADDRIEKEKLIEAVQCLMKKLGKTLNFEMNLYHTNGQLEVGKIQNYI